jgi:nitronate monooxygenase
MAGGPSTPELTAAVAAAGGFGFAAAGYLSPPALTDLLDRTRALTAGPIGVNVFVPGPRTARASEVAEYARALAPLAERFDVALGQPVWDDDAFAAKMDLLERSGVHTVSFTFGCPPRPALARLRAAGVQTAVTVTSAGEAATAADAGADLLIVQGAEAGGHQGTFDPTTPNETGLLSALAAIRPLGLPLIAAGGIMSAEHTEAALQAGAVAVQIGTALLATPEAGTSAVHRAALLERTCPGTAVTRAFSGRWARGLANRFAREHVDAPGGYPEIHHLTRPLRAAATRAGDADVPNLWAGVGWSEVVAEPAAEVVRRIAGAA